MTTIRAKLVQAGPAPLGNLGGTVAAFIEVLSSKLTQYDMRMTKRDRNIYRLGHLMKGVGEEGFVEVSEAEPTVV